MKTSKTFKILFLVFSFAGVLFSGYMSSVKFFSDTCAFGETCPYFFGTPACYYGFVLFSLLAIFSVILALDKWNAKAISRVLIMVSLLGILFAGYYSFWELPTFIEKGFGAYVMGLPTCIMGCVFFVIVFVISVIFNRKIQEDSGPNTLL